MKRFLILTLSLLVMLTIPSIICHAASSCTETETSSGILYERVLSWTDANPASWTAYLIGSGASNTLGPVMGIIYEVTTDPGTTAPTDNYGVYLSRTSTTPTVAGDDILGFACNINCDTANTESRIPLSNGVEWPKLVTHSMYLIITANVVNSATGIVRIKYIKLKTK